MFTEEQDKLRTNNQETQDWKARGEPIKQRQPVWKQKKTDIMTAGSIRPKDVGKHEHEH